ncbi:response regulator [Fluoribacter dumoffii]|uniref:response regulator n=1 Tax=Fluoribacter dumoffii TaxID=463 RepID=UPI002244E0C9|nr:response regulator [Fluoribacter dumoffii]MCW8418880.1 response regulator [Fluoribacter dumoffii]MCW8453276.1 response regulator [Fluoribacter dumoffii]MCW8459503.1 response regulator [Fluoribacter dumoffii]MCW8482863.1 response regulator [Fluoribacter dumoffii]
MLNKDYIILAIEDELPIRRFLKTSIVSEGYQFLEAKTGKEGLEIVRDTKPHVILLDLGLPDTDGINVIKNLRTWVSIPVIVLSAREQEGDKVIALDAGADDYLSKPFSVVELHARIRVALRHAQHSIEKETPSFQFGDFVVDLINREVRANNEKILLTPMQYDILATLIRRRNKIVTHKELLRIVWGENNTENVEYLRIYIHQLRHKLEKNPAQPQYLITEPGIGYRLLCKMEE